MQSTQKFTEVSYLTSTFVTTTRDSGVWDSISVKEFFRNCSTSVSRPVLWLDSPFNYTQVIFCLTSFPGLDRPFFVMGNFFLQNLQ